MERKNQEILYAQALKVAELFLEWRHKVMAFTFTVTAALLALAAWMYDHDLGRAIAAPLLLGSLLAVASAVFDRRNQRILYGCYRLGDEIETELGCSEGSGPLGLIPIATDASISKHLATYHGTLLVAYVSLSAVLLGVSGYLVLAPPVTH